MFGRVLGALFGRKGLIEEARAEAMKMLDQGREMFEKATIALFAEETPEVRQWIRTMDRKLNEEQQAIRRKVFEHLLISRGDQLYEGMVLVTIVVDLERIGDYTKNFGELVEMMPHGMALDGYEALINQLREDALQLFDLTRAAHVQEDPARVEQAMALYDSISKTCDGTVRQIFKDAEKNESVPKRLLAIVLVLRYMKRVCAHLKNITTAVTSPVDRIGFRLAEVSSSSTGSP